MKTSEASQLKQLIEASNSILITSHISPDPDAVSSALLMNSALKTNFPNKQIKVVLEEEPANLDFIPGYKDIEFEPIDETLGTFKPDLFILLDANNYERCSRHNGEKVRKYLAENSVKTVIIDHHEPDGKDGTDVYINQNSPACAQEVYETCFDELKLKVPADAAEITMVGLYADSGGFVYIKDGTHKRLFDLVQRLLDAGANIERIKNKLNQYSLYSIHALNELFSNIVTEDDYTYSFLSDDFIDGWLAKGLTYPMLQLSTGAFLNDFVRNIQGRQWGFIIYKNRLQGNNMYSVSLRAVADSKNVQAIAVKLGGGGHKPAAGAKFPAADVNEALEKVRQAISQTLS